MRHLIHSQCMDKLGVRYLHQPLLKESIIMAHINITAASGHVNASFIGAFSCSSLAGSTSPKTSMTPSKYIIIVGHHIVISLFLVGTYPQYYSLLQICQ